MIRSLPAEIGQLRELRSLDAYKNELIKTLPAEINGLVSLEYLNMFNCGLTRCACALPFLLSPGVFSAASLLAVPKQLSELRELTELNVSDNKLAVLPSLHHLTKLRRLAAFWNNLVVAPDLSQLSALEVGPSMLTLFLLLP